MIQNKAEDAGGRSPGKDGNAAAGHSAQRAPRDPSRNCDKGKLFLSAVLAGLAIGLGGTAFLGAESRSGGALLFTIGIFLIATRGYALFTGRLCYTRGQKAGYALDLAIIWLGNFAGANLLALGMRATRFAVPYAAKAEQICRVKLEDSTLSLLILGVFCNFMVFVIVDGFRGNPHELGKFLSLFLGVSVFALSGYEHCVADMFYFAIAGIWTPKALWVLAVVTAGNLAGGLLLPSLERWRQ